jgi:hypothetical protein
MGISISIGISPRESLADWSRFTGELEDRGVEELWLIDSQLAMKDAYIGLALAAQQTETMRLGTGVSNLITRHPTVTANGIAAIAELSAAARCSASAPATPPSTAWARARRRSPRWRRGSSSSARCSTAARAPGRAAATSSRRRSRARRSTWRSASRACAASPAGSPTA